MVNKQWLNAFCRTLIALAVYLLTGFKNVAAQVLKDSAIIVPLGGNGWVNKNAVAKITDRALRIGLPIKIP